MKWYPWLNDQYKKIITYYQNSNHSSSILIHSFHENGELSLCYAISRWLVCYNPKNKKSCGVCRSCQLMLVNNHPDFYKINFYKDKKDTGVDIIRSIIFDIYKKSNQGRNRVVFINNINFFTENAVSSLLKILEETPKDTYFLITCKKISVLPKTLISRCLYWFLPIPDENLSILWLKKECNKDKFSSYAALRLSNGFPLLAESLIKSSQWIQRTELFGLLKDSYIKNNFLLLLSILKNKEISEKLLHWILSFFVDILKWKHNLKELIVNVDEILLISELSSCWSSYILIKFWEKWINFIYSYKEVNDSNYELILIHNLLILDR